MSKPFKKLDFSLPFGMDTAVPVDYNSFFTSYAEASAAAATAENAGSSDSLYYIGQVLTVVDDTDNTVATYQIGHDRKLREIPHTDILTGYLPVTDNNGTFSTDGNSLGMRKETTAGNVTETKTGVLANGYVGVDYVKDEDGTVTGESAYVTKSQIIHSLNETEFSYGFPKTSGTLAVKSDIALPVFAETDSYPQNFLVVYDGAVWKCTAAVTIPGEWTGSANWTKLYDLVQVKTNMDALSAIEERIPNQTWNEGNELADKEFVNSSIATNTANFLGTLDYINDLHFPAPTSSADVSDAAIANALDSYDFEPLTASNNDYVFVQINYTTTPDVDEFRRFKYAQEGWVYEYTLNNSSFTAAQWAAINSGITTSGVTSYDSHLADTNNPHHVTAEQIGVEDGAEVNAIEAIKVNGTEQTIDSDRAVDITAVTGVKGAIETNFRTGQVSITAGNVGAVALSGDTMSGNLSISTALGGSVKVAQNGQTNDLEMKTGAFIRHYDASTYTLSIPLTTDTLATSGMVETKLAPFLFVDADVGEDADIVYSLPLSAFPMSYTYGGNDIVLNSDDGLKFVEENGDISMYRLNRASSVDYRIASFDGTSLTYKAPLADGVTNLGFNGVLTTDAGFVSPVLAASNGDYHEILLAPFANNTFVPTAPLNYSVTVKQLPQKYGMENRMRELCFVVDCSAISDIANLPTIGWDVTTFFPLGGNEQLLTLKTGRPNVFILSEFSEGLFMVGRETFDGAILPSNELPLLADVANAGSSIEYARGDHVHPSELERLFKSGKYMDNATAGGVASGISYIVFRPRVFGITPGGYIEHLTFHTRNTGSSWQLAQGDTYLTLSTSTGTILDKSTVNRLDTLDTDVDFVFSGKIPLETTSFYRVEFRDSSGQIRSDVGLQVHDVGTNDDFYTVIGTTQRTFRPQLQVYRRTMPYIPLTSGPSYTDNGTITKYVAAVVGGEIVGGTVVSNSRYNDNNTTAYTLGKVNNVKNGVATTYKFTTDKSDSTGVARFGDINEAISDITSLIADDLSEDVSYGHDEMAFYEDMLYRTVDGSPALSGALAVFNLVSDLELAVDADDDAITTALEGKLAEMQIVADSGDYCFVKVPYTASEPNDIDRIDSYEVSSEPAHSILLVKHGDRADNTIAFDSVIPVVCTISNRDPANYHLRAEKPVKVVLDYENQRHVYAVLDTQTIVYEAEDSIAFMNDENDTEEVDGSFWNHDVELTLYFADGHKASKTVRFVQL